MPTTMQALLFDRPAPDGSTTRVGRLPVPVPDAGEVSIDVAAAGVNFIDLMARRGDAGYVAAWPFVPGLEVAGTVRAVGPGVDGLRPGTRVAAFTASGGLADVALARAALAVPVPESLDLARAAAAPGALTTAALLVEDVARVRAGETVLVHSAAGGVGQALAQLARSAGAGLLLGTVGSAGRARVAERAGYDVAILRGEPLAERIRSHAPDGADVVLDPQGTELLDADLDAAAPGARIVLFGNAAGIPIGSLPPAGRLLAANASVGGFSLTRLAAQAPERVAAALRRVLDRLAAGRLSLDLSVHDGLAAAAAAHQALAERGGSGKTVIRVR